MNKQEILNREELMLIYDALDQAIYFKAYEPRQCRLSEDDIKQMQEIRKKLWEVLK